MKSANVLSHLSSTRNHIKLSVGILFVLILAGCSAGGGSASKPIPPPAPTPTITSIAVLPATITVSTNSTQQFQSTVTGTGNFSTTVNWSVAGLGSIDSSGLFTASGTPGTSFVVATSTEDSSVMGQANVTVQAAPVSLPGWYGTLVPSDGTAPLPLDFDLTQTSGTTLSSGPVLTISISGLGYSSSPCANLFFEAPPARYPTNTGYLAGSWLQKANSLIPYNQMTGSLNGQNVSLSFAPIEGTTTLSPITMTGTLGTDAAGFNTIIGTYAVSGGSNACAGPAGTFTFNQYENFSDSSFQGFYTIGTPGTGTPPVQANNGGINLSAPTANLGYPTNEGGATLDFSAVAAPYACPAITVSSTNTEHAGRFFHIYSPNGSSLSVYGLQAGPDSGGNVLTAYVTTWTSGNSGLPPAPPACFELPPSTFNTLIGGPITLNQQ